MIYVNSTTSTLHQNTSLHDLKEYLERDIFPENKKMDMSTIDEESAKYHRLCAIVSYRDTGKVISHFTTSLSIDGIINGIAKLTDSPNGIKYNADKFSVYVFRKIHMRQYLFLFPVSARVASIASDTRVFMRATDSSACTSAAKKRKADYYENRVILEASLSHLTTEQQIDTLLTVIASDLAGIKKLKK